MDDTTASALIQAINTLNRTLAGGGNLGAGSDTFRELNKSIKDSYKEQAAKRAQDVKTAAAVESLNKGIRGTFLSQQKQLSKFANDLTAHATLSGKLFDQAVENLKYENVDKLTEVFKNELEKSGNEAVKNQAREIKSVADVFAARMRHTMKVAELDTFEKYHQALENATGDHEQYAEILKKAGYAEEDLGKTVEQVKEELKDFGVAIERTAHQASGGGFGEFLGKAGKALSVTLGAALGLGNALRDVAASAARTGTQFETADAALMGMSPEELNQLQADHRQILNSSNMTFDQFNETVQRGAKDMWGFTGSLRDSIRVNAESLAQAKLLGADQTSYMDQQQTLFKRLNSTMSVTAEQFMEMNKQLLDSHAVQSNIYRLDVRRRAAYFQDLQNTYEKLRLDGLTHEQAQRMLETFAEIGAKSPKERLKEAAKLQAVMGAMGMGQMGAEAGTLMRGGLRGEGDKERFAEIMKQANIGIGERMGEGFASELMTSAMIQTAGLTEYLGPDSKFATLNTQQLTAVEKQTQLGEAQIAVGKDIHHTVSRIFNLLDQINAAMKNPVVVVGLAGIGTAVKEILKWIQGGALIGGAGGGLGKIFGKMKGAVGLLGTGIGATAAAGLAAAGGVWQAGQAITTGRSDIHDMITKTEIGKSFADMLGTGLLHIADIFGSEDAAAALKYKEQEESQRQIAEAQKQADIMNTEKLEKAITDGLKEHARQTTEKLDEVKNASKGTAKAVEDQTEQAKEIAEDAKKNSKEGYRIMWRRVGNTSVPTN